jgi:hypothetical protein
MKFLEEQGFGNCKPSDVSMAEGLKFNKAEMPTTEAEEELIFKQLLSERKVGPGSVWPTLTTFAAVRTKYRSVTAGMGWASQTTHPELQGSASMWASQMANQSIVLGNPSAAERFASFTGVGHRVWHVAVRILDIGK